MPIGALASVDTCTLFALQRESAPFLRRFTVRRRLRPAPLPAWLCGPPASPQLVVETGAGPERCLAALRWLTTSPLRPRLVIWAGFAGALVDDWRVGDVLFADEVTDSRGPLRLDPPLPGPWRPGRLLTTSRLVGAPEQKRRLAEQHQAVAVDMETATAARFCVEQGIPFRALRVISDDVSTSLSPELIRVLGGSRVSVPRLLSAVVRSPRLVPELWRLARATRLAARRLADALGHLTA
jgi:adenosylhomocysteine nucleosidase